MNKLLVFVILLLIGSYAEANPSRLKYLGYWKALSKASVSVDGDLVVSHKTVSLSKHGSYSSKLVFQSEDKIIFQLSKAANNQVQFLSLGFGKKAKFPEDLEIEVAFFSKLEQALAKKDSPLNQPMSWGIYYKPITKTDKVNSSFKPTDE